MEILDFSYNAIKLKNMNSLKIAPPIFTFCNYIFGIFLFGIWFLVFGTLPLNAASVDHDTTYPKISVIDTAEYYKVTISAPDSDSLFNIAYVWGVKPHVYAYVAVANDDTANWQFSARESLRWEYIQKNAVQRWDKATYNKHPMDFVFMKNPLIISHTKQEVLNTFGILRVWSLSQFMAVYQETLVTPYIYIYRWWRLLPCGRDWAKFD
jgi:hypothetical protein